MNNAITDVPGILVGHAEDAQALTGCTVILCMKNCIGGVDQRGGAPGTRETDALRPMHLVDQVHAILLTGGSAFGLGATSGVMDFLEAKGIGYNSGGIKVPIVPAAVIFDLGIGNPAIRPTPEMALSACKTASSDSPRQGNAGAGMGATVGKILGPTQAMKSGIGTSSIDIGGGLIVGALVVVNALGDVVDPTSRKILAGVRTLQKGPIKIGSDEVFANTLKVMKTFAGRAALNIASHQNTVIGVVATNAKLSKEEVNKVAQMAQNGVALAVQPAHTMYDGDTMFAIATNQKRADVNIIGAFATQAVSQAIVNAVKAASPAGGLPCYSDFI